MADRLSEVREYWNSHLNSTQFVRDHRIIPGSDEFVAVVDEYIKNHHRYKDTLLMEFREQCVGGELLEVGCGAGLELGKLAKLGFTVSGIDLAPKAVEMAGRHLRRLKVKGRALIQNVEQMEFSDASFDAIYSSGVLQHTPNIRKAIGEMMRVLRPGGKDACDPVPPAFLVSCPS